MRCWSLREPYRKARASFRSQHLRQHVTAPPGPGKDDSKRAALAGPGSTIYEIAATEPAGPEGGAHHALVGAADQGGPAMFGQTAKYPK